MITPIRSQWILALWFAATLLVSPNASLAGDSPSVSANEQCANQLFEMATATHNKLSRRAFVASAAAVASLFASSAYQYVTFRPHVYLASEASDLRNIPSRFVENNIVVNTRLAKGTAADSERKAFVKAVGLSNEASRNLVLVGTAEPFLIPRLLTDTACEFHKAGRDDSTETLILLARAAKSEISESKLIRHCLERMKNPNYFENRFPMEAPTRNAAKELQSLLRLLASGADATETEIKISIPLDGSLSSKTIESAVQDALESALKKTENELNDLLLLSTTTDSAYPRLILAAFAAELASELSETQTPSEHLAMSQYTARALLPSAGSDPQMLNELKQHRASVRMADFAPEMRAIYERALKEHKHILLVHEGWERDEMKAALESVVPGKF